MSKLDDLINKLCPDGVEFKRLGDFATVIRGGNFQKKDFIENGKPCIHYGQMYTHFRNTTDKVLTYLPEAVFNVSKQAEPNDIVMAVTSENVEDVCSCVAWLGKENIAVSGHTAIIHHNQNPSYMSYYFHSEHFYTQKTKLAHGTKVIEVTPSKLEDIQIPVPPLEIQNEIVRILDNFTELEEELEEELEARRKQYEYYRDSLLSFDDSVEWKTLGEITNKITDGMHNLPNCVQENTGYPIISAQNINNGIIDYITNKYVTEDIFKIENKRTLVAENDVLLTIVGAIGRSAVVKTDKKMLFQRSVCVIKPNGAIIDSSFLKYMFDSRKIQNYIQRNAQGAAQKGIYLDSVKKIKIPVPSLERQKQIAEILDRFDALTNDITSGLPAEIEARHKQYEYYRDKLLTFKRKEA